MEIEDKVELTHVSKVFIQDLHKGLHQFQDYQLVFVLVNNSYEVERCKAFVHDFEFFVLKKIAHFGSTSDDHLIDLA